MQRFSSPLLLLGSKLNTTLFVFIEIRIAVIIYKQLIAGVYLIKNVHINTLHFGSLISYSTSVFTSLSHSPPFLSFVDDYQSFKKNPHVQ